jgi:hypothetical protein
MAKPAGNSARWPSGNAAPQVAHRCIQALALIENRNIGVNECNGDFSPTDDLEVRIAVNPLRWVACGVYAAMAVLSEATWEKVREMFPSEQHNEVGKLLQTECGNNLPFLERKAPYELERFRFAALKWSEGSSVRR